MRRRPAAVPTDLCSAFCSLYIAARGLNTSAVHRASTGSNNATPNPMHSAPPGTTRRGDKAAAQTQRGAIQQSDIQQNVQPGEHLNEVERRQAAAAALKAKKALEDQKQSQLERPTSGSLAANSVFADRQEELDSKTGDLDRNLTTQDKPLEERNYDHMEPRLNPKPEARARWMSKMVIKDVRRRSRMTREMFLARTERTHTVMSPFYKTSVKKLAPLARQIAGKSIDEAILQMRFSKKKAAKSVLKHLVHSRNEAIVAKGMGLPQFDEHGLPIVRAGAAAPKEPIRYDAESLIKQAVGQLEEPVPIELHTPIEKSSIMLETPADTPALPIQNPDKTLKKGVATLPTDMYIAQAWVNRGKYAKVGVPRARGRMDIHMPPYTGISVMLKEEKTRTREKQEKEIKALRKRMEGKIWMQLPDRPVTRQSQYVLW